jgi:hypothetical protein
MRALRDSRPETFLAAIKVLALLTDYGPYYFAVVLLLLALALIESVSAERLLQKFVSYNSGTVLNLPMSAGNLASVLGFKEGLWDLVAANSSSVPQSPGRARHAAPEAS